MPCMRLPARADLLETNRCGHSRALPWDAGTGTLPGVAQRVGRLSVCGIGHNPNNSVLLTIGESSAPIRS